MSARRRPTVAATVVLTVVWLLLWERVSLLLVLTGVLLAVLVFLVFPLPVIERPGRVRPVALARLVGRLLVDVVRSSVSVIALAFSRRTPTNAIVRVRLRTRSDLFLTVTAEMVSLVPGSIALEVRRADGTLYLHVLDTAGPEEVERAVRDTLAAEARVLLAFGSDDDVARVRAEHPTTKEVRP